MSDSKNTKASASGSADPSIQPFWRVGKVIDAHGIRGELFILLFAGEADWLKKLKTIWLRTQNIPPAPSVSEAVQPSGSADLPDTELTVTAKKIHRRAGRTGLIVRTEEIKTRSEAEALKGSLFYIPDAFLNTRDPESFYLKEILGFQVFDSQRGSIGFVESFGSNGAQDLIQITFEGQPMEIPLVDAFIEKVDFDRREIHLTLPDGLMDLSEDSSS